MPAGFPNWSDVGRWEIQVSRSRFRKVRNRGLSALSKKEQLLEHVCESVGCKDHRVGIVGVILIILLVLHLFGENAYVT
jgi:hypothetical protein